MKTCSTLFLSFVFILMGCHNPTGPTMRGYPSIGNVSGQISDWTYGSGYSIALTYQDSMYIQGTSSSSIIDSDGSFSLQNLLSPPQSSLGSAVYPSLNYFSRIVENSFQCSDSSARFIWGQFEVRDSSSATRVGDVLNANFDLQHEYPTAGDFSVSYYYVTKDVNLSGTIRARIFGAMDTEEVELITHYDLNYRKGWNKEVTLYSSENDYRDSTKIVYSREYWYTNYEPYQLKWIYYPVGNLTPSQSLPDKFFDSAYRNRRLR